MKCEWGIPHVQRQGCEVKFVVHASHLLEAGNVQDVFFAPVARDNCLIACCIAEDARRPVSTQARSDDVSVEHAQRQLHT